MAQAHEAASGPICTYDVGVPSFLDLLPEMQSEVKARCEQLDGFMLALTCKALRVGFSRVNRVAIAKQLGLRGDVALIDYIQDATSSLNWLLDQPNAQCALFCCALAGGQVALATRFGPDPSTPGVLVSGARRFVLPTAKITTRQRVTKDVYDMNLLRFIVARTHDPALIASWFASLTATDDGVYRLFDCIVSKDTAEPPLFALLLALGAFNSPLRTCLVVVLCAIYGRLATVRRLLGGSEVPEAQDWLLAPAIPWDGSFLSRAGPFLCCLGLYLRLGPIDFLACVYPDMQRCLGSRAGRFSLGLWIDCLMNDATLEPLQALDILFASVQNDAYVLDVIAVRAKAGRDGPAKATVDAWLARRDAHAE
jgi:hypothetical protein